MTNPVIIPERTYDKDAVLKVYECSQKQLDKFQIEVHNASIDLENAININVDKTPSDLDMYDYLFASVFGILGAVLSTNKHVDAFCKQIHTHASGNYKTKSNNIQKFFGDILYHNGDSIDQIGGSFINRFGDNTNNIGFHRLLWGHDPVSLGKDNPFYLMIKEHGLLNGAVKAFRHLVADTFSSQGLPIPGHSFFDSKGANGKPTNLFLETSMKLANNDPIAAQKSFSRTFTIHAQDIVAQGFVWAAAKAYFFARGIDDLTRMRQYKIVTYAVNFFTHAGIGAIRQGGIPYISWPALTALIKETAGLFIDSYREIRKLESITDNIIADNIELERQVFATGSDLKSYSDSRGYIMELQNQDKIFSDLVSFFEEE